DRYLGLGPLHTVDLDRARDLARANRLLLREGKDPQAERDTALIEDRHAKRLEKTVNEVADEWFNMHMASKSRSYRTCMDRGLRFYVGDTIGPMPIKKITRATILNNTRIKEIWTTKKVDSWRLLSALQNTFRTAIENGYYHDKNPMEYDRGLQTVLPSLAFHKAKHVDPLPLNELQRFMEKLRAFRWQSHALGEQRGLRPSVALMIEFTILNGARQGEVRQAQWKE